MTLFLSDIHLGNKHCDSHKLFEFLGKYPDEDEIFLVGDIFDDHSKKKWNMWDKLVLDWLTTFKKVVYLPGNHDHFMKKFIGQFGNVHITPQILYHTKDKTYLVVHGDQYDWLTRWTHFISISWFGKLTRRFFQPMHGYLIGSNSHYERELVKAAKRIGVNGVICGHNHEPCIKTIDGIKYINCGDWVESYTGVIEKNGSFKIAS